MVSQLREDKPILRDTLHPRTDIGNQSAGCPDSIVEDAQSSKSI
jgi:hypothetical protein